jgi:hypothetical protein
LHTLWDSCIVEERLGLHPLAIVRGIRAGITDEQRAEWLASNPVDWANELFVTAQEPGLQYCITVDGTCQYAADNREFDEGEPHRVVVVDDSYMDRHALDRAATHRHGRGSVGGTTQSGAGQSEPLSPGNVVFTNPCDADEQRHVRLVPAVA